MANKVLIIQFRDDASAEHELKCFSDLIKPHNLEIVSINAIKDTIPENPATLLTDICCVILGGSGQYDLSKHPYQIDLAIQKTKHIFNYIFENDFPTLGICFGHQLITYLNGGEVHPDDSQAETGTILVSRVPISDKDSVFGNLPKEFIATLGHKESVTRLPSDFTLLAYSEKCKVQAFKFKKNIYGVQFHPELAPEGIIYRLTMYSDYMKGKDIAEEKAKFKDSPYARELFSNFVKNYLK